MSIVCRLLNIIIIVMMACDVGSALSWFSIVL